MESAVTFAQYFNACVEGLEVLVGKTTHLKTFYFINICFVDFTLGIPQLTKMDLEIKWNIKCEYNDVKNIWFKEEL